MLYTADISELQLKSALAMAVRTAINAGELPPIEIPRFSLYKPKNKKQGDLCCNAAFACAKTFEKSPKQIADIVAGNIDLNGSYFIRCEAAGLGFINFFYSFDFYADIIWDTEKYQDLYGMQDGLSFTSFGQISMSDDIFPYYVQFTHARICSILRCLEEEGISILPCSSVPFSLMNTPQETELVQNIGTYPNTVKTMNAFAVIEHSVNLSSLFHSFYNNCRVRGKNPDLVQARVHLCRAVKTVLNNTLTMFSVDALEYI